MAGAGYKTWTRERLSISDLQQYLQDQVVLHYPSAAARDTALPTSLRFVGLRVLTLDTLTEVVWTGGGWVQFGNRRTKGYISGVVPDASGLIVVAHGLGATPTTILITPGPQASSALENIVNVKHRNADSNGFVALCVRTDQSVPLTGNPVSFSWSAEP